VSPASRFDGAERRQLTVMFCDLAGSTALAARLYPEELRELIGAYHRCVAEAVRRFDGFVAKYTGDGVLAYFGFPRAHEDDAERAVRAGLDIVAAVEGLDVAGIGPLRVRIGVATGLVVVGDLVGEGPSQEQAVVGETPNLAARLQAVAKPGGVVVAPATRRLRGNLFRLQAVGRHEVKGLPEAVEAWGGRGGVDIRGPLRGRAQRPADRFCRPRARTRPPARALEPGAGRRGPGGAVVRRTGDRQEPHPERICAAVSRRITRRACASSARRTTSTARSTHRVRNVPLLIVLTHRPEFATRWSHYGHVTVLTLNKLTRQQSCIGSPKVSTPRT
jgi:class 3 adenylate cyclase